MLEKVYGKTVKMVKFMPSSSLPPLYLFPEKREGKGSAPKIHV